MSNHPARLSLNAINEPTERLIAEQHRLGSLVTIPETGGYEPRLGDVVLALDAQYACDQAYVASDLSRWGGEHLGTYVGVVPVNAPYVPGYFCFREGPALLALIERLRRELLPEPGLLVVDGHGIAHPRRFGLACWLGVVTGKPAIGCAKESLLRYEGQLAHGRGSVLRIQHSAETVGCALRTQEGVSPVFVSPGNLVSLDTAASVVLQLTGSFRVPDPLRRADHAARCHAKAATEGTWTDLGQLASPAPGDPACANVL